MQWTAGPNAGFCPPDVEPWLPVASDAGTVNVEIEARDARSMLSLTTQLLRLRRASPALETGRYCPRDSPEGTFVYTRETDGEHWLVALNLTASAQSVSLPGLTAVSVLSTHLDRDTAESLDPLDLRPNEGCLIRLEGS